MGQVKTNESKRILIVEDDLFLREMYKTKLESEDFEVVTAEDGEKGLKMALGQKIDLVLLDIVLPKKDGFEVLAELKADKVKSSLPVILLTNLAQREDVEKGLRLGADDYIIKAHFVPSEVVKKILVILSK